MPHSLENFADACHAVLATDPGPAGREKARRLLEQYLAEPDFVAGQFDADPPPRKMLYEDPKLGFRILAHADEGANEGNPHDHGPSWAIYGQAAGVTEMTEWKIVERGSQGNASRVEPRRHYRLSPGDAVVYNEGDIHSPRRTTGTRLIRIEGQNLTGLERPEYQAS